MFNIKLYNDKHLISKNTIFVTSSSSTIETIESDYFKHTFIFKISFGLSYFEDYKNNYKEVIINQLYRILNKIDSQENLLKIKSLYKIRD